MILTLPPLDAPIASGTAVVLVYEEGDQACTMPALARVQGASAEAVTVKVGPIDHAVATWALTTGSLRVAKRDEALPDCTGMPPVHPLYAPPHGVAVGLERPATATSVDGTRGAASLGGADWWVVFPEPACTRPCQGELAFTHADGPPTLFTVHNDPAVGPDPVEIHLPPGGAAVLKVREGTAWHWPTEALEVVDLGSSLLVMCRGEVTTSGFVRLPGEEPRPVRLAASGGWGQAKAEPEVAVQLGKKRAFRLDRDMVGLWVSDPSVATGELAGRRLKLSGLAPGRTHVALDDGSGEPRLVRIVVPEGGQ